MTSALSMRLKSVVLVAIAVFAVLGVAVGGAKADDHSPVIDVPSANAEMAAAIANARATLPTFWASYENPKPSEEGHSLKVRFPNPRNNGEHIWMADVKKLGNGTYSGRFANAPRDLPGKRHVERRHHRGAVNAEGDLVTSGPASLAVHIAWRDVFELCEGDADVGDEQRSKSRHREGGHHGSSPPQVGRWVGDGHGPGFPHPRSSPLPACGRGRNLRALRANSG